MENLKTVLYWLSGFDQLEIILVEQDSIPHVGQILSDYCGQYIFIKNVEFFNRAKGFNIGVKQAKGKVVALGDGDIVMDRQAMSKSFDDCYKEFDAVNPYGKIIDLSRKESRCLRLENNFSNKHTACGERKWTSFCGGIVLFKKSFYEALGGFDEAFEGWGGEDDAMSVKIAKVIEYNILDGKKWYTSQENTAYHLWHERPHKNIHGQKRYPQNLALSNAYYSYDKKEVIELISRHRKEMSKYDKQ